jgi:hypothetical protein
LVIDGYTIDVKTKKTTVTPKPAYLCSITTHNPNQKCDYYMFVRIKNDLTEAFILGYIKPSDFLYKAVRANKGVVDVNGFVFKGDCYNVEIRELHKIKKIK